MGLERFLRTPVSRRQGIEIGVQAVIGSLTGNNLLQVEQQSRGIPWANQFWWPLDPVTARKYNIPILYAERGVLDIYDQLMGGSTHAREEEQDISNRILHPNPEDPKDEFLVEFIAENPEAYTWFGHCDIKAALGMLVPQPVGSNRFSLITKDGLLVAATKGRIAQFEISTEAVPGAANGKGAVVDLKGVGRWFRTAFYFDYGTGEVYLNNFGNGFTRHSLSTIRWAHVPYIDFTGTNPAREEFTRATAYLRNTQVDLKTVIEIVYNR